MTKKTFKSYVRDFAQVKIKLLGQLKLKSHLGNLGIAIIYKIVKIYKLRKNWDAENQ